MTFTEKQKKLDMLVALSPTVLSSLFLFGIRAGIVYGIAVASVLLFQFALRAMLKETQDLPGSFLEGLLTAMLLPSSAGVLPILCASLLTAAAGVLIPYFLKAPAVSPVLLSRFVTGLLFGSINISVIPSADAGLAKADLMAYITGYHAGMIGETCFITLLIGSVYLMLRGTIRWDAALAFIVPAAVVTAFFGLANAPFAVLSGSLMFIGLFFVPDERYLPSERKQLLFLSADAGVGAALIRCFMHTDAAVAIVLLAQAILFIDKRKGKKITG